MDVEMGSIASSLGVRLSKPPSPLRGRTEEGGVCLSPLTLALSRKGRGYSDLCIELRHIISIVGLGLIAHESSRCFGNRSVSA